MIRNLTMDKFIEAFRDRLRYWYTEHYTLQLLKTMTHMWWWGKYLHPWLIFAIINKAYFVKVERENKQKREWRGNVNGQREENIQRSIRFYYQLTWLSPQVCVKPCSPRAPPTRQSSSMVVHTWNPSIWKVEVEGPEAQGSPALQGLVSEKTKLTQRNDCNSSLT